jgi:hypothetical protein
VNREDYINFYTFVLHNEPNLCSVSSLQSCMEYVEKVFNLKILSFFTFSQFYAENQDKCVKRVKLLVDFFDIADTNKVSRTTFSKFNDRTVYFLKLSC